MRIKAARKSAGLTQQGLADKIGVVRSAVANWEIELSLPKARQLPDLASALGCSISDLFNER